jgi:hypothetical protein
VVQHALLAIAGPVFERGFIGNTFANRVGKGHSHRGKVHRKSCPVATGEVH